MKTKNSDDGEFEPEGEIEVAIVFGTEKGILTVEWMKSEGTFKYRLYYYDCAVSLNEEDRYGSGIAHTRSEWFSDLKQALDSSRWEWWMMPIILIEPDLKEDLLCIIKANPKAKASYEVDLYRFRRLKEIPSDEERLSIEELRRIRAEDPCPARCLWSGDDMRLGMTEEEKKIVTNARAEDWDYNGNDGYEPPEAKAILDKYTSR